MKPTISYFMGAGIAWSIAWSTACSAACSAVCCILLISSCTQRKPHMAVRIPHQGTFAAGAQFAIADTSYLEKYGQRIAWTERLKMNEKIIEFLLGKGLQYNSSAPLVINYYREHYDSVRDGTRDSSGINTVTMRHQRKDFQYMYPLHQGTLANDRDGALIIDVYDTVENKLIRQACLTYYFSKLETAYRESNDDSAAPRASIFFALGEILSEKTHEDPIIAE